VPRLRKLYSGICLTIEENHGKPQSGNHDELPILCSHQGTQVDTWSAQVPAKLLN